MREIHDTDDSKPLHERIGEIRRERRHPQDPLDSSGTDPLSGFEPPITPSQTFEVSDSNTESILACVDCETYYEDKDKWKYCPQCAAELTEMDKA
jgi:hypothetical protein